jgi:SAM-dependent methyltransferase
MASISISERLRDHYAGYSPAPSEWARAGAVAKAANVVALCRDVPHRSVLEIGAGEGSVLQRLADLDFAAEFHAVDIAESAVAAVRRRSIPGLATAEVFDGATVPHEDARFDLVVFTHVLEHAEFPRRLLYEAARVGRHVFVEVPLEDHWRLPRDFVLDVTGHINFYRARSIRRLVQSCGLQVLAESVTTPAREAYAHRRGAAGVARWWVKELALRAVPWLATRLWTYHGAVLCAPIDREGPGSAP